MLGHRARGTALVLSRRLSGKALPQPHTCSPSAHSSSLPCPPAAAHKAPLVGAGHGGRQLRVPRYAPTTGCAAQEACWCHGAAWGNLPGGCSFFFL